MSDKKVDDLKYDKRVMHRYLSEGKISQKEAEQYLEHLPDLADQCHDIAEAIYGANA